jgi:hypothetical protein
MKESIVSGRLKHFSGLKGKIEQIRKKEIMSFKYDSGILCPH